MAKGSTKTGKPEPVAKAGPVRYNGRMVVVVYDGSLGSPVTLLARSRGLRAILRDGENQVRAEVADWLMTLSCCRVPDTGVTTRGNDDTAV